MRTTRQGVRDLGASPPKHQHRFVPETYLSSIRIYGRSETVTRQRMTCYCGAVIEENEP